MTTFTYNGHTYLLTDSKLTWEDAQAQAINLGGHLVTINDQAEQEWLSATFAQVPVDFDFSSMTPGPETENAKVLGWIGYTDKDTEGTWKWVSGETSTYTNWYTGEPNGSTSENYAQLYEKAWLNGTWNDVNNSNSSNGPTRGIIEINSTLVGTSDNDFIKGTCHDDLINGLAGADTMVGGRGDDSYYVENIGDVVKERADQGEDTVYTTVSYTLASNVENIVVIGTAAVTATGNALNNHLTGNGAGSVLDGGAGHDNYYVSQAGDTIAESANNGWDTVISSISYTLEDNLEELYLTGTDNLDGTGNAQDNNLNGNAGNNFLDGKEGADWMAGGAGDDAYFVDNAGDQVEECHNEGIDRVFTSVSYRLTDNVEDLVLVEGTDATNGTGNNLDNKLWGNSNDNVLKGGNGDDFLYAGDGSDTVIGGRGQDDYDLRDHGGLATDTVRIAKGDSSVTDYDTATFFGLGTNSVNTDGVDKLDLNSNRIAADAVKNGIDSGIVHSHSIENGIINFDDLDVYSDALAITNDNLNDVFAYLQDNIKNNNTVAFVCEGNTFVFQDGGTQDTLVELVGVTATSLSNTGLAVGAIWLV